jgi:hypothetical protein
MLMKLTTASFMTKYHHQIITKCVLRSTLLVSGPLCGVVIFQSIFLFYIRDKGLNEQQIKRLQNLRTNHGTKHGTTL